MALVDHVVVDSGAFIKNANIRDIGQHVYTTPDVLSEIRDRETKRRLRVLPYELKVKIPDKECIQIVTEFTKQTGDYPSLSATDIQLIALTYSLEKQHVGVAHLKTVPDKKIEFSTARGSLGLSTDIAGFYVEPTPSKSETITNEDENGENVLMEEMRSAGDQLEFNADNNTDGTAENADNNTDGTVENAECVEVVLSKETCPTHENSFLQDEGCIPNEALESYSDSDSDSEDEAEANGWITPKNVQAINMRMGGAKEGIKGVCKVGCLTTDFAMQNVLIQFGLNVVSINGFLIKKARNYVLRCYACFKITTNMTKLFCFHCGNKTLQKVAKSVNEDGSIKYFVSKRLPRKPESFLGALKGGKYAINPLVVEDQPMPQQRAAKPKKHYGVFDADYIVNSSPFATNDTTSRSAHLGLGRNFNMRGVPSGNRKKRK